MVISHLTDVEGNLRYLKEWVERSQFLQFCEGELAFRSQQLEQKFVFGGDFCDKGPGDLRIGALFLHFKKNNPNDVFLIAGNREIKYRRFSYELRPNIRERLLRNEPPFWKSDSRPLDYVKHCMTEEGKTELNYGAIKQYINDLSISTCLTLYLKWMLTETMGCGSIHQKPAAFDYRRRELAQISNQPLDNISDNMVTQSFIDAVSETGLFTQYLQYTQLGKILGDTLFLHGAVTVDNMGHIPNHRKRIADAREWIDALNEWYAGQIKDWVDHPYDEKLNPPGYKPLDYYVVGNPYSVVTTNWLKKGKLAPIDPEVIKYLNQAGIYRVVSGHQPFADFPLIIREQELEIIVGDTSYSDTSAKEDNRGLALHNLAIHESNERSYVSIDAIRQDGTNMRLNLPSRQDKKNGQDIEIGYFTQENRIIRPFNQSTLVSSQMDGFDVLDYPYCSPLSKTQSS